MKMQHLVSLGLLVAIAALGGMPAARGDDPAQPAAKTDNPHVWSPRTKSVAVFKNGMGFFMREGQVITRDGWVVAKDIPPAAFGTLAIYSLKPEEIVDVVGAGPGEVVEFDGVDASQEVKAKRERLSAAKNLNLELKYAHANESRTAAGKLVSVGEEYAILESGGNSFAVPVAGITRMQILELPLRVHVTSEAEEPSPQTEIGMAYLREGITWIPEYSLRVLDDNTAEMTLRGTVVNEAEDLVHCDVHFVVGVPHFAHTEYMAPIAVGQVIRSIGSAVAPPQLRTQIMNRAAIANNGIMADQFDQSAVVEQPVPADGGAALQQKLGNLPQLEGPGGSDYTVYTKKDLTLRRGERAIVTLFVEKIKFAHLYRWSPPSLMEHFLVLNNNTDTAWTTGPCLALSAERPLSEDLLKYTPKGGKSEIPVSAAINIAHEKSESEVDRKFKAHSPATDVFLDLVTLQGELLLKNFEKSDAEIVITTAVPGKPVEASDGGVRSSDPTKLQLLEREGSIRWTVKLKPNESKVLQYKYERYVPSR